LTYNGGTDLPETRIREMPGPTGERNTWMLKSRGLVACLGPDEDSVRRQRKLVTDSGNTPVTATEFGGSLRALLEKDDLALVLYEADDVSNVREILAARKGKRVPLIDPNHNVEMLFGEKAISEDTTASGGNASLLASVG
jgi:RHH-type proline utilization regulon transcriptional repressor/proline dehydrogenase/delta 1-pyrroline-5-carboxylate dehydrogenase